MSEVEMAIDLVLVWVEKRGLLSGQMWAKELVVDLELVLE